MKKIYFAFIAFIFSSTIVAAQETQWSVGLHGGPLINFTEDFESQGGFLVTPGFYFTKNQRFEMGILPYYGQHRFESFFRIFGLPNALTRPIPRTFRYRSAGVNYQWRYTFNTKLFQPYAVALAGIGYTWYSDEQEPEFGGTVTDSFATMNYGMGLGLQYVMNESLRLDMNVMLSGVNAFEDPAPEMFVQPTLGVIYKL